MGSRRSRGRPSRRRSIRPGLEPVEARTLLAVFTVTTTLNAGPGSLRQAILDANATPEADTIAFDIDFGGPQTIAPTSSLPTITSPLTIDGTTQPGYDGRPLIELNGAGAGVFANGLTVSAPDTTIQGLVINRFRRVGIVLQGEGGAVIRGNYIGTDLSGTAPLANGSDGIRISSPGNTIGGTTFADRNVVSGNAGNGILINADGNVVLSNIVGVAGRSATGVDTTIDINPSAVAAVPNGQDGIQLGFATGNVIGVPGAGNLVGGNAGNGIALSLFADGNRVEGNAVGTTFFITGVGLGPGNLGNGLDGINLTVASSNTIGGTAAAGPGIGGSNVISGNDGFGLFITGGSGNLALGNLIGVNATGNTARPNASGGVALGDTTGNTLGGTAAGARNVIAGNAGPGVQVVGEGSRDNALLGNRIGAGLTTTLNLGNAGDGVLVRDASATAVRGNLVVANAGNGVLLTGATATANLVAGNLLGVLATGEALGNAGDGVRIEAPGNTVGGTTAADRNVISANQRHGVALVSVPASGGGDGSIATGNLVLGNYIGLAPDGTSTGVGNQQDGLFLADAPTNTIGGTAAGARNVVSGNRQSGIHLTGTTTAVVSLNNVVGLDADGAGRRQGNLLHGIFLEGVSGNAIGGSAAGAGNVLSNNGANGLLIERSSDNLVEGNRIGTDLSGQLARGNGQQGISLVAGSGNTLRGNVISANGANGLAITGPAPSGGATGGSNLIAGNRIGLGLDGTTALGNGLSGVLVTDSAANTIGGTASGAGNVVSGNGLAGVMLSGAGASSNVLQGNRIGTDAPGNLPRPNGRSGVILEGAPGNLVGGVDPGARNLISANGAHGVELRGVGASGNTLAGNFVGTDATGLRRLGNAQDGVFFAAARGNVVGGSDPRAGNVLSGNGANGVQITLGATGNVVRNNRIGTDPGGVAAVGNAASGVVVFDAPGNAVVGGNVISANGAGGVVVTGTAASGNRVQGNLIGTDANGSRRLGNTAAGLTIDNAPGNLAGGSAPGEGNLIAANQTFGLVLINAGATGNRVEGNLIGVNPAGDAGLGNALDGVLINNAPGNVVGGTAGARNVISGNGGHGLNALNLAGPNSLRVVGNFLGTDPSGRRALGNALDGVVLNGVVGAVIGDGSASNVISGNGRHGLEVTGGSRGTAIRGNLIGTDAAGRTPLGNAVDGILLADSSGNAVGGASAAERNVVAANGVHGIHLAGAGSTANYVQGNYVGVDAAGSVALGNGVHGIALEDAAGNVIGGLAPGEGNLVSGNAGHGILVAGASGGRNLLFANTVGTDAAGSLDLGNGGFGVSIEDAPANVIFGGLVSGNGIGGVQFSGSSGSGNVLFGARIGTDGAGQAAIPNGIGVFVDGSASNVIGGDGPGLGNLISGNTSVGVYVFGRLASGNVIQGNLIGTDATGSRPILVDGASALQVVGVLVNNAPGLDLQNAPAPGNVVGGLTPGARNVISGNTIGVQLSGADARGNVVLGNFIGPAADGGPGAGNLIGVYLNGAPGNVIGGGPGNVISGNAAVGVYVLGVNATGNRFVGNLVGVGPDGSTRLPNQNGFYFENAPGNTIGGTAAGDRNVISANAIAGVYILGAQSVGNVVTGNLIGPTATGATLGNGQYGVLLYNAPINTVVRSGPGANTITGSGIANFREFTGRPVFANPPGGTRRARARAVPRGPLGRQV